MSDVLVIGELNVDILLNKIQSLPVIGQEILAGEMTFTLGSSSAIFAANLASLGAGTSFCGMVGSDAFGRFVVEQLNNKNVDTHLVIESPACQTGATVILNYGQDRANVTHCGAMEHFVFADIPAGRFRAFRHLHFSSYFLQKGLQKDIVRLFKTAREQGLSTSLDLQWDPENAWRFPYKECLPYVDFFMPNEAEVLALTGTKCLPDAFKALDAYVNTLVIKQGLKGALAYKKGVSTEAAPFLHDQFVDAVGAGDSFNAGFIHYFLQGRSLEDCLRFGNLTGAINTTAAGGTAAFPNRASIAKTARSIFNLEI